MNKSLSAIIIGVILVASFFVGYTLLKGTDSPSLNIENGKEITPDIPSVVLAKYEELEPRYKESLGTSINYCTKNAEKIYTVHGNGGYGGVFFYYTGVGSEIGSYAYTDSIDGFNPPPKPPINIQEYGCIVIKESEQFVNE